MYGRIKGIYKQTSRKGRDTEMQNSFPAKHFHIFWPYKWRLCSSAPLRLWTWYISWSRLRSFITLHQLHSFH